MSSSLMFFHDALENPVKVKKKNQKRLDRSRSKKNYRENGPPVRNSFFSLVCQTSSVAALSFFSPRHLTTFKKMNFSIPASLINDFSKEKADIFFSNPPPRSFWMGWDAQIEDAVVGLSCQKDLSQSQLKALAYLVEKASSRVNFLDSCFNAKNFEAFKLLFASLNTSDRSAVLVRLVSRFGPLDCRLEKCEFILENNLVPLEKIRAQKSEILWRAFEEVHESAQRRLISLLIDKCSWNDAARVAIAQGRSSFEVDNFLSLDQIPAKDLQSVIKFANFKGVHTPKAKARHEKWLLGSAIGETIRAVKKERKF